jgi:hypothetical protein
MQAFNWSSNMKNIIGFALTCAALLFAAGTSAEKVYESTDESGDIDFSDQPSAGAEQIDVVPNVVHMPTPPPAGEITTAPVVKTIPDNDSQTVDIYHHHVAAEDAVTEDEALRRQRRHDLNEETRDDEEVHHNEAVHRDEAEHRSGGRSR